MALTFTTLTVSREVDNKLVTCVINRPKRLNALNTVLVTELHQFLDAMMVDTEATVVLLAGEGRAFCAGADLKATQGADGPEGMMDATLHSSQTKFSSLISKFRRIPQPVVCAVQGAAVGGGMSLALACDVRVASVSAYFKASYLQLGLSAGEMGSTFFLPRFIGHAAASEILLLCRTLDAKRALALGLVTEVVSEEELRDRAHAVAVELLNAGCQAGLRLTKESLNASAGAASLESHLAFEDRAQLMCLRDPKSSEYAIAHLQRMAAGAVSRL